MIIDMQRVFAEKTPWQLESFHNLEKPLLTCYDRFDMAHVLFTQFKPPTTEPKNAWSAYYRRYPFCLQPKHRALFALAEPYDNLPGNRHTASTFDKWSNLPQYIRKRVRTLYLCGVSTGCCILSTALAAIDAGVQVVVVRDACTALTPQLSTAVERISLNYAPLWRWTTTDSFKQ